MMQSILQSFPALAVDLEAQDRVNEKDVRTPSDKKKSGSAYLDGLRGLAAVTVFNHHTMGNHGTAEENVALASSGVFGFLSAWGTRLWFMGGTPAVCFFFILSGYVLSLSTFKAVAKDRRRQCRKKLLLDALRRLPRLYLPVLAIAYLVVILMQLPGDIYPDTMWYSRQDNLFLETINFLRVSWGYFQPLRGPVKDVYAYDVPLWTIPNTLKGSLLVYMVLIIITFLPITRKYTTGTLAFAAMLLLLGAFWVESCFFSGIAIAAMRSDFGDSATIRGNCRPWIITTGGYTAVITAVYLLGAPSYLGKLDISLDLSGWRWLGTLIPPSYTEEDYFRFWHTIGAVLLLLGLHHTALLRKPLDSRPMQFVGRLSFMIYAIHAPIAICIAERWGRSLGLIPYMREPIWLDNKLKLPDFGPLRITVCYVGVLGTVVLLSHWATRYIDEPCARLCKMIGKNSE